MSSEESRSTPPTSVCRPLINLSELQTWHGDDRAPRSSRIPLLFPSASSKRSKVLACHDLRGGYLEDRFVQGVTDTDAYMFWNWWQIDTFVYFSHEFVTIPPPCWIDAGHCHGVTVLGTFITEWDDGKERCKEFLKTRDAYSLAADKLVSLACYYGFDGWLINIENVLEGDEVSAMRGFVEYLSQQMHQHIAHSMVIWYDSVINTGELKWQNELNENNRLFFDACDGIFLNYTWKNEHLERSRSLADCCGRAYDVYVGVDVFGRGCLGDGGFNTKEAVEVAKHHDLSLALFAHGWTFERADTFDDFIIREYRFWNLLRDFCPRRLLTNLPLVTSFCRGSGLNYYLNGQIILNHRWTNLSLQQLQPNAFETSDDVIKYVTDDAFIGGGCIQLSFSQPSASSRIVLFEADVLLDGKVSVSYTYKACASSSDGVFLSLVLVGRTVAAEGLESQTVEYYFPNHPVNAGIDTVYGSHDVESSRCFVEERKSDEEPALYCSTKGTWITRTFIFAAPSSCRLTRVAIEFANNHEDSRVLLGEIQIIPPDSAARFHSQSSEHLIVKGCITCTQDHSPGVNDSLPVLNWLVPDELQDCISHFVVYAQDSTRSDAAEQSKTDEISGSYSTEEGCCTGTDVDASDIGLGAQMIGTSDSDVVTLDTVMDDGRQCIGLTPASCCSLTAILASGNACFEVQPVTFTGRLLPSWQLCL